MKVNKACIELVKEYEGFRGEAYQDIVGVWTIGYGETLGVKEGDTITMANAHANLVKRLNWFGEKVQEACTIAPNENELAAMTSLAYNIGVGGFRKSTVLKAHNRGDQEAAARAFSLWNKAGGSVVKGLVRRRAAEAALYLRPVGDAQCEMPQMIDNEKPLTQSTIAGAGTITAVTSGLGAMAQMSQHIEVIKESLGDLLPYFAMGAALIAVATGAYVVVQRWKQRRDGWA